MWRRVLHHALCFSEDSGIHPCLGSPFLMNTLHPCDNEITLRTALDLREPPLKIVSFIFNPCYFQLSAISSDAILTDTQRAALQYVISRSAQDSKNVFSGLLARVQRLGYSENDLTRYAYEGEKICDTYRPTLLAFKKNASCNPQA